MQVGTFLNRILALPISILQCCESHFIYIRIHPYICKIPTMLYVVPIMLTFAFILTVADLHRSIERERQHPT